MIITKSDIAQIQTNIKEQESKIIKTGVEALRKFFEDEKRDMIYILQKKVTKMHQLYEAKKDGIENEKKIKEELKNKVEGQEEREYVDTLNKLKRNRKALKEEIRENEEKKKEIFEALKWQNITDLKRGKMMEQLRIDEMRENHMRRDIIDLERRITSLIREREDLRMKRIAEATRELEMEKKKMREIEKRKGPVAKSAQKKRIMEAKERLMSIEEKRMKEVEFMYINRSYKRIRNGKEKNEGNRKKKRTSS